MGATDPATIGIDYGTASVRAVVVDTVSGDELGEGEYVYRHGTDGAVTVSGNRHLARRSPQDYVDGLRLSVQRSSGGRRGERLRSPPAWWASASIRPVRRRFRSTHKGRRSDCSTRVQKRAGGAGVAVERPHLARRGRGDHTEGAREGYPYLATCGGTYSSEWYWSKLALPAHGAARWRGPPRMGRAGRLRARISAGRQPRYAGPRHLRRRAQGDVPRRLGRTADGEFLDRSSRAYGSGTRRARPPRDQERSRAESPRKWACPPAFRSRSGRSTPIWGPWARAAAPDAGENHRHQHLRLHAGAAVAKAARRPGLCGIVPESIMPGFYGLEAGQPRWATSSTGSSTTGPARVRTGATAQELTPRPRKLGPARRAWSASTGTTETARSSSIPLLTGLLVGQTLHTTAPEIYRR